MADESYASFEMSWDNRLIQVSYLANWLRSGHWHLELRCDRALPVTQTGYRSRFIVGELPGDNHAIRDFVLGWLNGAAEDPKWQKSREDDRQLNLF